MDKGYNIVTVYHRLVQEQGGKLPFARELSEITGAPVRTVRACLKRNDLPYAHIADPGFANRASCEANHKRTGEKEKKFREQHAILTRSLGRYPTRIEMNAVMGYKPGSYSSADMANRLGLELQRLRRRSDEAPVIIVKKESPHEREFNRQPMPNMARVYEIRSSGEARLCPARLQRAGEAYDAQDRIMLTCPVCGAQALIAPRMHPFFLRNLSGEVIFVDSRACTGQAAN